MNNQQDPKGYNNNSSTNNNNQNADNEVSKEKLWAEFVIGGVFLFIVGLIMLSIMVYGDISIAKNPKGFAIGLGAFCVGMYLIITRGRKF